MQTIGKYQVLEVLGQGGMGVVYRARDNAIGRQVALKVMRPEVINSADLRERFLREARAAGNLQHPNIVVIYDLGEDNGSPYIAMEFLSGQALDKALDAGTLSTTVKLSIFAQVCDGLQFAHEAGVVHRDIKPANVMLERSGAKLLDFGIARVQGSQMTRNTAIIGTVSYMSPEQIRGRGVDARSDIFSAGVMLYEMLGGRRPFDQDSDFETMQAIVAEPPPELEVEGVISPDTLAAVVRRALEKDPAARYQTAHEFGEAVRGYLRSQERSGTAPTVIRSQPAAPAAVAAAPAVTVAVPQPTPPVPVALPEPRKTGPAIVVLAVLLLIFVGVYGVVRFQQSKAAGEHLSNYGTRSQVPVQLRLVVRDNQESRTGVPLKGTTQYYELKLPAIVDESDIVSAESGVDAENRPILIIRFTTAGGEKLRKASAENVGRQMAIVINAEVVQLATIQTELGESIQVSGLTSAEAEDYARRINGEAPATSSTSSVPAPVATNPSPTKTPAEPTPAPATDESATQTPTRTESAEEQVYRIGEGVSAPRAFSTPRPEYTDEARKAQLQGIVRLSIVVGSDGRVRNAKVVRSLGMGLDEKAIEAVRQWKFEPAMKDGKPVAVQMVVETNFQLY